MGPSLVYGAGPWVSHGVLWVCRAPMVGLPRVSYGFPMGASASNSIHGTPAGEWVTHGMSYATFMFFLVLATP